jgi:hypothetical protein
MLPQRRSLSGRTPFSRSSTSLRSGILKRVFISEKSVCTFQNSARQRSFISQPRPKSRLVGITGKVQRSRSLDGETPRLQSDKDVPWKSKGVERRHLIVRRRGHDNELFLVGIAWQLSNFEQNAKDDPEFIFLLCNLKREKTGRRTRRYFDYLLFISFLIV